MTSTSSTKTAWKALLLLCVMCFLGQSMADENASPPPKDEGETLKTDDTIPKNTGNRARRELAKEIPVDTFDAKSHFDWGTYYDPKNVFCGKFDCYGILGFDYESFEKEKPTQKAITKRYRALSRHWHPDKSKHPEAKQRFQVRNFSAFVRSFALQAYYEIDNDGDANKEISF